MTKEQEKRYIEMYNKSNCKSVLHFYKSCSCNKICAEMQIETRMEKEGGHGYRVLCGNCNYFTCGYRRGNDLIIDTYLNTYEIKNAF